MQMRVIKDNVRTERRGSVMGTLLKRHIIPTPRRKGSQFVVENVLDTHFWTTAC